MISTTNTIESMISVPRTAMSRVKRWREASMKKRWVAAGMLEAEKKSRRIMGYRQMPSLVEALRAHARAVEESGRPVDSPSLLPD